MSQDGFALEKLGWTPAQDASFTPMREKALEPGRVACEDKHHYVLFTTRGELLGQAAGKLLHSASSPADLPKVGDWVAFAPLPGEPKAIIHQVLPRRTRLSRKVPGRETEEQVLATNVDAAFIVHALDRTLNLRLLERYLLMALDGGVKPVVVLNKTDLCAEVEARVAEARQCAAEAPVVAASAKTGKGVRELRKFIRPADTVVFVGSSGVGKSSLINRLHGEEVQPTTEVREGDAKGRHTTMWREMIALPKGGLVIDTPGIREFHLWMARDGVQETFPDIDVLAARCKFRDCTHGQEKGCAVQEAIANGALPAERFGSYLKLRRELEHLAQAQRHQKRRGARRPPGAPSQPARNWEEHDEQ